VGRKAKQGTFPLRLLREERDISLSEMVQKIGYTKGYISAVETGTSRATPAFLAAYERALNLSSGSLQDSDNQTTHINDVLTTVSAGFDRDAPATPAASNPPANNGVLEGVQAVILQAIALITAAASQPPLPGAEIIITFQSQDDPLMIYPDLAKQWRQALRQAMAAGWNIVHLWRLHGGVDQRFNLISKMLSMLGYRGRYQPYILPSHTAPAMPADLIIVAGQGALSLWGSRQANYVDSAFLFTPDSDHFTVLSHFASTMRAQSQPLLEMYPERSLDFKTAALQAEAAPGDQLLVKEGLALQVMPVSIRAACIDRILRTPSQRSHQEQISLQLWCQTLLDQHTRRIAMFEEFLRQGTYTARHIVIKDAIRQLLTHGRLPMDDWLRDEPGGSLTLEESIIWLRNVITLLETHPTFHLAIVDSLEQTVFPVYWKVEGRQTIILESWQQRENAADERENVNLLIHDPTIAVSFRDHFMEYWERLPSHSKEKRQVIAWLNEQISAAANPSHEASE
jgi:hypothetical protein